MLWSFIALLSYSDLVTLLFRFNPLGGFQATLLASPNSWRYCYVPWTFCCLSPNINHGFSFFRQ